MVKKLILTILLFNTLLLKAQVNDTTNNDVEENTTNVEASMQYMNKAAFSGRDYMVNSFLMSPAVSLNFKFGLSLGITTYFMPDDTSNTHQWEFSLSYNKNLFDWWNIEGGYTLFRTTVNNAANKIKTKASTQTQTDNGLSMINTLDFDWMFFQNYFYYIFGTQNGVDIMFMAGKEVALDDITGIDDLSISPTLTYELGNHFAKFRKLKKTASNIPDIVNVNKFQALNYEISLPIEYELKAFTFNFTPSFAFPINILPTESNLGSHFFYFSAMLTYRFNFKKAHQ